MTKTIDEIREIISEKAAFYGFRTESSASSILPQILGRMTGFRVWISVEDCECGEFNVKVESHIAAVGGSPSPDELLEAADEITRAASLTAELQAMGLSFRQEELRKI